MAKQILENKAVNTGGTAEGAAGEAAATTAAAAATTLDSFGTTLSRRQMTDSFGEKTGAEMFHKITMETGIGDLRSQPEASISLHGMRAAHRTLAERILSEGGK